MRTLLTTLLLIFGTVANALPDGTNPPALRGDRGYLTNVETAIFAGPVADVIATLQDADTGVLAFVERTDRIAEIEGMTPIKDAFPNEGAIRRLSLSDGSHVVERVLENSTSRFAYQVWGFTSPQARALSHIRGEFRYEAWGEDQTQVTWTYAVAPRLFLVRPFLRSFLKNDFAPFMESGLQGAAAAYNARTGS